MLTAQAQVQTESAAPTVPATAPPRDRAGEPLVRPKPPAPSALAESADELGAPLDPRFTFDNFVTGKPNEFAVAAARRVADEARVPFNPLFLYGAAGLGKTHLLQAIGHRTMDAGLKVIYLSAEQFTNQLITAIGQRRQEEFRQRYRSADVLLIDDIQFIAGKEGTQEEFFHTFNDLYESGRQIVITSDKSPALIQHLEERLRTRFEWGMIADIQAPDMETQIGRAHV